MMNLNEVLNLLPHLKVGELRLIQTSVEKELDKHIEIDRELFHLVFEVVGEKPIALSKFSCSDNGTVWRRNISAFTDLENKLLSHRPAKRGLQLALRKFLIELLIQDMRDQYKPITLKQVCLHLARTKSVFRNAFPNYLENGKEHLVIARIGGDLERPI